MSQKSTVCSPTDTKNCRQDLAVPAADQWVSILLAQRPPRSWRSPLALQFTQPGGFWMRVHPACTLPEVLYGIRSNRAQRGQA